MGMLCIGLPERKAHVMRDRPAPIEMSALIPEYWNLTAHSRTDLLYFGKVTIRQMVRHWRGEAGRMTSRVKDLETKIALLEGKTVADLLLLAKNYENPEFPEIGLKSDSWGNDPEPLDAASISREHGATTFNVCGWCQYASGGSCRFNYYVTTYCGILRDATFKGDKTERRFDTPCFITEGWGESLPKHIVDGLITEKSAVLESKKMTDRKIRILLGLEKRADRKPALPNYRPYDWFNLDDPIVAYVGNWDERIGDASFETGVVVNGYRHHDGCVSVRFDNRVHTGDNLNGHGGGYGMSRPEVMHAWEFEYLLENLVFATLWAKQGTSSHLEGFDADKFLSANVDEAGGSVCGY